MKQILLLNSAYRRLLNSYVRSWTFGHLFHRKLKPQNELNFFEKTMCAKLYWVQQKTACHRVMSEMDRYLSFAQCSTICDCTDPYCQHCQALWMPTCHWFERHIAMICFDYLGDSETGVVGHTHSRSSQWQREQPADIWDPALHLHVENKPRRTVDFGHARENHLRTCKALQGW